MHQEERKINIHQAIARANGNVNTRHLICRLRYCIACWLVCWIVCWVDVTRRLAGHITMYELLVGKIGYITSIQHDGNMFRIPWDTRRHESSVIQKDGQKEKLSFNCLTHL